MSGPFRVGCAQIGVTDSVQANLEKIIAYIHKADSQGVKILLFPETALSGYRPFHYKDKPFPAKEVLEEGLERVCRQARETGLILVLGTTAYEEDGLYNIVYFIDGQGEIRASYSKAHGTGGKYFKAGKTLSTFEFGGMKFGMEICYDARFPEAWRIQALEGADVIFHVSHAAGGDSWKIPVWEAHLRSRAAENGIWVVSCNAAGPIQAGKSYIIDPDGLLVAESNQEKEELIMGLVDLSRPSRGILNSRRKDLYRLIPGDASEP
ncbi:MAG TPA: carbon-nitrogen hydrolase family protein [archaeon]|nr:carbon-nitrogen hydrolase family protein [archaeon]